MTGIVKFAIILICINVLIILIHSVFKPYSSPRKSEEYDANENNKNSMILALAIIDILLVASFIITIFC